MSPDVLCIGSVMWDVIGRPDPRVARRVPRGGDVPGRIVTVPGGVALNAAVALRRLGLRPTLLGAVGRDAEGHALVEFCAAMGVLTEHLTRTDDPTDRFLAIEGADGMLGAIADARSLEAAGARILAPLGDGRLRRPWRDPVVLDGNATEALLGEILGSPLLAGTRPRVVPASSGKAIRLRAALGHPAAVIHVDLEEAGVLLGAAVRTAAEAAEGLVAAGAARAVVTDGPRQAADATPRRTHLALPREVAPMRGPGAGKAFLAAHLAAEHRGADADEALERAVEAATAHVAGDP